MRTVLDKSVAKPLDVPLAKVRIPLFKPFLPPPEVLMPRLEEILYSGYIAEGEAVREFERKFGEFIGWPHVVATSSGTAALHLALLLAGVGPGDEVISTPMTAEPTNLAIKYTGADIMWADVERKSGNIDSDDVVRKITEKTKAVMAVSYGGIPVSSSLFWDVPFELPIIHDMAHALGAREEDEFGIWGNYVVYSFQAIKHMTTTDGGALTVLGTELGPEIDHARRLRWFGMDRGASRTSLDISELGYKYNMNNVTATIGLVQLDYIQNVIDRHIENGQYFQRMVKDIPGVEVCEWDACAEPSFWFFTILAERRDGLSRKLTEAGIANGQVHRRNDLHTIFADSRCELLGLDWFYAHMLHIPCGWWVTDEDREYIVNVIKGGW